MQETQETQVQSLGQEDPLEKKMATFSRILAWKISWTVEPVGLQSKGLQRVKHEHDWVSEHEGWAVEITNHMINTKTIHITVHLLKSQGL